jgi:hypothetical protein
MKLHREYLLILVGLLISIVCCDYLSTDDDDNEETCEHAPFDCISDMPQFGFVRVIVNKLHGESYIPVTLFKGTIEQGETLYVTNQQNDTAEYTAPLDYISSEARYEVIVNSAPAVVKAVDGGNLSYKSTMYCEGRCYEYEEITLVLRLDTTILRKQAAVGSGKRL